MRIESEAKMEFGNIGIGNTFTLATFTHDLGRQYCAVSKMDAMFIPSIMGRI